MEIIEGLRANSFLYLYNGFIHQKEKYTERTDTLYLRCNHRNGKCILIFCKKQIASTLTEIYILIFQ